MTPQAFSYATVGSNKMIYCPPYGLNESLNFMIKIDPLSYKITKIPLEVDSSKEKWEYGIVVNNSIVFLPYNESKILILNTINDSVEYVNVPVTSKLPKIFVLVLILHNVGVHLKYFSVLRKFLKAIQGDINNIPSFK